MQNKDNKCFQWCHIRHLNPQLRDPQRIKKHDILNKHKNDCIVINGQQAVKMPVKGEKIMFKNYQKQLYAQFLI